jgi:hypothetical protein
MQEQEREVDREQPDHRADAIRDFPPHREVVEFVGRGAQLPFHRPGQACVKETAEHRLKKKPADECRDQHRTCETDEGRDFQQPAEESLRAFMQPLCDAEGGPEREPSQHRSDQQVEADGCDRMRPKRGVAPHVAEAGPRRCEAVPKARLGVEVAPRHAEPLVWRRFRCEPYSAFRRLGSKFSATPSVRRKTRRPRFRPGRASPAASTDR